MLPQTVQTEGRAYSEGLRYVANGLVATGVHYMVLVFNLHVLNMPSAGFANFFAAIFGITASFLGSRYFVFRRWEENIIRQAVKFGLLYAAIAMLHGLILFAWTDVGHFDYRIGFLFGLVLQVVLSYTGNKRLVFR